MIALLIVCEGSKQMRTFAGLVGVAVRSRTTIFESKGGLTLTNWPVLMSLSKASFIIGSLGAA